MDSQQLLIYGFAYFIFLIVVAWLAERSGRWPRMFQAMVYGLSLGVYCSSWTFLGAVGNASAGGWSFLPIYLGPILLFIVGWPFVRKLMVIGARNKVTSLADFIGSRYGKDQRLAALVTLVAVIGTLPYIALQLRAIALAWSSANVADWLQPFQTDNTASLFAAIFLGWFAIIFGTRVIEGQHRHRGLLTAVATESIVKLVAFFGLALFALYLLISIPNEQTANTSTTSFSIEPFVSINFYAQLIIAAAAVFCLPRQFHVMVVEYHDRLSTRLSRWLFPIYLLLFAVCVVPIVEAGRLFLADSSVPPDSYVLSLPSAHDQSWLMLLAFLGALSAATSMVLVATVALSIMISNELIVPLYLNFRAKDRFKYEDLAGALRYVRRLAVIGILFLSWLLDQTASRSGGLSSMGLLAFASSAQLMPSIVAGLYWGQGHRKGVIVGILAGCLVWGYCLLLPALLETNDPLLIHGPWGMDLLRPQSLFGSGAYLDSLSHGVFWSLGLNILLFVLVSNRAKFTSLDLRQAYAFLELRRRYSYSKEDYEPTAIEIHKLQSLINPLLGPAVTGYFWSELEQKLQHRLLPYMAAPRFVVQEVEDKLASIIGAVSAHRAIDMLRKQKPLQMEDIATLMGGTSQQLQFSQSLLQTTLENIPQGISVVDENLNLVAWNRQYEQLFNYPPELLFVGCPIERIYRHNAMQGLLSDSNNIDAAVKKRLLMLRTGLPYRLERQFPNNTVIEIQGTPIPSGGYVTAFTNVTAYHQIMSELEDAKEDLEIRVTERTEELSQANTFLKLENQMRARIETELKEVHASKNRFLAAASHDLLQPINAARLLIAAVNRHGQGQLPKEFEHVDSALANAEAVVSSLREIAKLDSGKLTPNPEPVGINSILEGLCNEFAAFADKSKLELRYCPSSCWVNSDQVLLRRVIQNLLSNAIRYTRRGKVLVGCRRRKHYLAIDVWDTGPGIAEKDQSRIFEEFERINVHSNDETKGLGLGLSISLRIVQLLGHRLELKSWPGKGSMFRVIVPLAVQGKEQQKEIHRSDPILNGLQLLCVDNEPHLLAGLQALLTQWGCEVTAATSLKDVQQKWCDKTPPDLVIADYQLDNNETGLDVLNVMEVGWKKSVPTLIISADNSEEMQEKVKQQGYLFLAKPVQPANLRLTLRRLLRSFAAGSR